MTLLTNLEQHFNCNEGSGTTVDDSTANGRNGLTHGLSAWGTGKLPVVSPEGLIFDGSTNFVSTTWAGVTGTAARSFNAWVKVANGYSASQATMMANGTANSSDAKVAWNIENGNTLGLRIQAARCLYTATNLNNGNWHMVSMTMAANPVLSGVLLYMDGTLLTNVADSGNTGDSLNTDASGLVSWGWSLADTANYITGSMDVLSTWSRQLSGTEITTLYNGGVGLEYPFTTTLAILPNVPVIQPRYALANGLYTPTNQPSIAATPRSTAIFIMPGIAVPTPSVLAAMPMTAARPTIPAPQPAIVPAPSAPILALPVPMTVGSVPIAAALPQLPMPQIPLGIVSG